MKINEAKDLLKSLLETAGSIVKFSFFSPLALKKEEEKKKSAVITTVGTNVKRMQRYTPLWTGGVILNNFKP